MSLGYDVSETLHHFLGECGLFLNGLQKLFMCISQQAQTFQQCRDLTWLFFSTLDTTIVIPYFSNCVVRKLCYWKNNICQEHTRTHVTIQTHIKMTI